MGIMDVLAAYTDVVQGYRMGNGISRKGFPVRHKSGIGRLFALPLIRIRRRSAVYRDRKFHLVALAVGLVEGVLNDQRDLLRAINGFQHARKNDRSLRMDFHHHQVSDVFAERCGVCVGILIYRWLRA